MVEWVLGSGLRNIYDPAFGLGAFYKPVSKRADILFTASELDPAVIEFWRNDQGHDTKFVNTEDYLLSWGKKHQNIVCNPPYMRFQKFLNRDAVSIEFQRELGMRLSGYTNTASAFLMKSLSEMDGTGRLAYIMPLEFLNAGYGTIIKERLIASRHLVSIIRLACEKEVFPDATTSVGIILYDSREQYPAVSFNTIQSISELSHLSPITSHKAIPLSTLKAKDKWLPHFDSEKIEVDSDQLVPLEYYGRFSRGIATGANEYFVLRPSSAKERGFLENECVPCITKSLQIKTPIFDFADYAKLKEADSPALLFSVNGQHSKAAEKYIQYGEDNHFNERFLTKNRCPWYKTESRQPAPLLLGVFSRGGYKIILNRSNVLNLTCFHGFQPNLFGTTHVKHLFLYMLSKSGRKIISLSMRKYGDSLDKFEPNDLNGALVPSPDFFKHISDEIVEVAVQHIERTGYASEDVEEFFESLISPTRR